MHNDFIRIKPSLDTSHNLPHIPFHTNQSLITIPEHRNRKPIHINHLHHPATRRNRPHRMRLRITPQRQPIRIRMRIPRIHSLDRNPHPRIRQRLHRPRQPLIRRIPTHQSPKQTHIRPLRVMRRRQRPLPIKLHQNILKLPIHHLPRHPPNPQRRRTMRTRRPTHHRPNHIIENTYDHKSCRTASNNMPRIPP